MNDVGIVIDNGTGFIKSGFAGDDAPKSVTTSVFGKARRPSVVLGINNYFGQEAQTKKRALHINYPIQRGVITNWNQMEKIWENILYHELQIDPSEHEILLTEPPLNRKGNREKMAQIMFEQFECTAFCVAIQSVLELYSTGSVSGLVISSGSGASYIVPIIDGHCINNCISKIDVGGQDITQHLTNILPNSYNINKKTAIKMKEKLSYTATDYDEELEKFKSSPQLIEKIYILPDGQIITVGHERFIGSEALFQPNLINIQSKGIHELMVESIMKCNIKQRKQLLNNIIINGANTLFKGFEFRLKKEIKSLINYKSLNITAPKNRKYGCWIGGSILSSLSIFDDMWIKKQEYNEFGSSIVYRKYV